MADDRLAEFVDQLGNRFTLDTSLQVVISGQVGYIEENAHTFHGRMHIYFPHLGHDLTRSLSEIDSMTEAARHWIAGFLAGCEPGVEEYLGIDHLWRMDDAPEATNDEYERWRSFTARFRATGYCPELGRRPVSPLVITADEVAQLNVQGELAPWALAGERVWVPSGTTWVEADPQPELIDGEMPGTTCAERGHSDRLDLESGWEICIDCAEVWPPA